MKFRRFCSILPTLAAFLSAAFFSTAALCQQEIEIDGGLDVRNNLTVGFSSPPSHNYNVFAYDYLDLEPQSGDITSSGDLYIGFDLEIYSQLYLSKELYMEGTNSSGQDADQTIFFYEGGSRVGEYLRWDDSAGAFRLSDDIWLGEEDSETAFSIMNNFDIVLRKDQDNDNGSCWFRIFTDGGAYEQMRIEDGDEAAALFDGTVTSNGLDYAESFKILDESLEAGDVVVIMPDMKEYVRRSSGTYDPQIVGIISNKPGYLTGASFDAEEEAAPDIAALRSEARARGDSETEKKHTVQLRKAVDKSSRAVALTGRVPVKVDEASGVIRAGDYLTSGPTPGHAMAMSAPGKTLGMALEDWAATGKGTILALVQPGWYQNDTGYGNTTGGGNVLIGYEAGYGETGSNKLYIDNTSTTSPLIYGEFDNDLVKINGTLEMAEAMSLSDERMKKNIQHLTSSLTKVSMLEGVSFDWKTEEYTNRGLSDDKQIGLIAQEVEKVLPELVKTGSDGYKSLSYTKLTAVLVEAVKELRKEQSEAIKVLMDENQALKAQIEEIKAHQAMLETILNKSIYSQLSSNSNWMAAGDIE